MVTRSRNASPTCCRCRPALTRLKAGVLSTPDSQEILRLRENISLDSIIRTARNHCAPLRELWLRGFVFAADDKRCAMNRSPLVIVRKLRSTRLAPIQGRTYTVLLGSGTMLLSQAAVIICGLITTAILGRALTKEQLGFWFLLVSLSALSGHLDLGLGQGLRNKLASISERQEAADEPRVVFSSVFSFLSGVALIGILLTALFGRFIPWTTWLHVFDPILARLASNLIALILVLLLVNAPLNLGGWGLFAYQESHWRAALDGVRALMLLAIVALTVKILPFDDVVLSYYVVFTLAATLGLLVFFRRRGWSMSFATWQSQISVVRSIGSSSLLFWLLGLSSTLLLSSSSIMVGRVAGLAQVGDFRIVQQMFSLLTILSFTLLTPLWSAYTHAAATDDWAWIRKAFLSSLLLTCLVFIGGGSLLALLYRPLSQLWIGRVVGSIPLIIMFCVFSLLTGVIACLSVLLNGLGRIRVQAMVACFVAIINLPLGLYFGYRFGTVGVLIGSVIALLPLLVVDIVQVQRMFVEISIDRVVA